MGKGVGCEQETVLVLPDGFWQTQRGNQRKTQNNYQHSARKNGLILTACQAPPEGHEPAPSSTFGAEAEYESENQQHNQCFNGSYCPPPLKKNETHSHCT